MAPVPNARPPSKAQYARVLKALRAMPISGANLQAAKTTPSALTARSAVRESAWTRVTSSSV